MKLYTSYYAKVSRASEDVLYIRVSNTVPAWFTKPVKTLSINVFPDWSLINAFKGGEIDYQTFCTMYRRQLTGATQPEYILHEIKGLAMANNMETVVLLCYEKTNCHRTELARIIDDGCYCGEL